MATKEKIISAIIAYQTLFFLMFIQLTIGAINSEGHIFYSIGAWVLIIMCLVVEVFVVLFLYNVWRDKDE